MARAGHCGRLIFHTFSNTGACHCPIYARGAPSAAFHAAGACVQGMHAVWLLLQVDRTILADAAGVDAGLYARIICMQDGSVWEPSWRAACRTIIPCCPTSAALSSILPHSRWCRAFCHAVISPSAWHGMHASAHSRAPRHNSMTQEH